MESAAKKIFLNVGKLLKKVKHLELVGTGDHLKISMGSTDEDRSMIGTSQQDQTVKLKTGRLNFSMKFPVDSLCSPVALLPPTRDGIFYLSLIIKLITFY